MLKTKGKTMQRILSICLAIATTLAISINKQGIYEGVKKVEDVLQFNVLIMAILVLGFFIFYQKTKQEKIHPLKKVLAILFALCLLIGESYAKIGAWDLVFENIPLFLLSVFQGICYYFLFIRIFSLIDQALKKKSSAPIKIKNKYLNTFITLFKKHPFLVSLGLMLLFWFIYMIAFYPLVLSNDPSFQIKQFFNVKTKYIDYVVPLDPNVNLTAHHPVLHTLLLGGFIKLGRLFGSDNFGLFLYAICQTLILASALACTITYLYKRKGRLRACFILLAIYCLVPMFPFYAMAAVKDTLYTSFVIFYVLFLLYLTEEKNKKISWPLLLLLLLNMILVMQLRNNGVYVILLSFPFLLLYRRREVKQILLLGAVFVVALGSNSLYNNVILPYFKIPAGSIREVLSVPFQQTARYVKEHKDEVTEEEKEAIDTVLGYDDLAERYDPELADDVKNNYNRYTTKEELKEYFQVWFAQFLKHPDTYVQATLNNTYGYFYPNTHNWYLYDGEDYSKLITEDNLVDYHYNSLGGLRIALSAYGEAFPFIPILGLISNIGFQAWLLLLCTVYVITSKKKRYFIILMPLLVSLLICFVSPANTYFRYTMPYIFMMPFILCYTTKVLKKDDET